MLFVLRFIILSILLSAALCVSVFLFALRPRNPNNAYWLTRYIAPLCLRILGIDFSLTHQKRVTATAPCIIVENHQHFLDFFTACATVPKGTISIGKHTLAWVPIFSWAFWLAGHFFINRRHHAKAMATMQRVKEVLTRKEASILIMPEGTRIRAQGLGPFKKGAFHLAKECDLPILPIVVSTYPGKINLNKWHAGVIRAEALQPLLPSEFASAQEMLETTHKRMDEALERLDKAL